MKKLFIPFLLASAGVGLYFYLKKDKSTSDKDVEQPSTKNYYSSSTSTPSTPSKTEPKAVKYKWDNKKVLKLGSKGLEVKLLQVLLNQFLQAAGKPLLELKSGVFGKQTALDLVRLMDLGVIESKYSSELKEVGKHFSN